MLLPSRIGRAKEIAKLLRQVAFELDNDSYQLVSGNLTIDIEPDRVTINSDLKVMLKGFGNNADSTET